MTMNESAGKVITNEETRDEIKIGNAVILHCQQFCLIWC